MKLLAQETVQHTCTRIAGLQSVGIQVPLVIAACTTLFFRWHKEKPQRDHHTLMLDVSKQCVASSVGLVVSALLAVALSPVFSVAPCGYGLICFLVESVAGTAASIWVHSLLIDLARDRILSSKSGGGALGRWSLWHEAIAACGSYGNEAWRVWVMQSVGWVASIVLARVAIIAGLYSFSGLVVIAAKGIDRFIKGLPQIEQLILVVIVPLVTFIILAGIQDNHLSGASRLGRPRAAHIGLGSTSRSGLFLRRLKDLLRRSRPGSTTPSESRLFFWPQSGALAGKGPSISGA